MDLMICGASNLVYTQSYVFSVYVHIALKYNMGQAIGLNSIHPDLCFPNVKMAFTCRCLKRCFKGGVN
jgi:hypothetical protein